MRTRWFIGLCILGLLSWAGIAQAFTGTWSTIPAIAGRIDPSMVYDPVGDRLVLFGGSNSAQKFNETWMLSLGNPLYSWSQLLFSTSPAARTGQTAIYDAVGQRMIVFGGLVSSPGGDQPVNEVWALSFTSGTWQQLMTTGAYVDPRAYHTAVYDSQRRRMVVFGGQLIGGAVTGTAYSLDLATLVWVPLATGPVMRYHAAAYDPVGDQMFVFGGDKVTGGNETSVNETWRMTMNPNGWTQLTPINPPLPTVGHRVIFDPIRRELVDYGGSSPTFGPAGNAVYRLAVDNPQAWVPVLNIAPDPSREEFGATYDSNRGMMVIFGGTKREPSTNLVTRNDTWGLSLGASPAFASLDMRPYADTYIRDHTMVYDPIDGETIMFGGTTSSSSTNNNVFVYGLASAPYHWAAPTVSGTPPAGRSNHSAVYDPDVDRMIVFGGFGQTGSLQDVWSLNLSGGGFTWVPISPTGTAPSPRYGHSAIYANRPSSNRRMIVFGGVSGSTYLNDVWALNLSSNPPTWQQLSPSGHGPSARLAHTAVYDYIANQMVVFGGQTADGAESAELYTLDLNTSPNPTWTKLTLQGPKPPARSEHAATISPYIDDQMVVFGGQGTSNVLSDTWVLSRDRTQWTQLTPTAGETPAERSGTAAVYSGYGVVTVVGGTFFPANSEDFNDTWNLTFNPPTFNAAKIALPVTTGPASSAGTGKISLRFPSVCRSQATFQLLLDGRPANHFDLAVYDVSGRLCRRLAAGSGVGNVVWDLRNERGDLVPSGIYFVKAAELNSTVTGKLIVVR